MTEVQALAQALYIQRVGGHTYYTTKVLRKIKRECLKQANVFFE